ncbi:MAG: polyribonucleotide nucleotidyltransferase [Candidatus Moraniibacteriota bacterium]|nr:MAG: polyribonucleotide nucleotidyltransferase [Candidatus Moranbacteria bacterium]
MSKVNRWTMELEGRTLTVETGELAKQANGSVCVSYGETVVLATATMSKRQSGITGYFPLMVDYEERFYASGKIKGSRFIKREGRPTDEAILNGRLIDRTIRPLFDMRMRNDVQVIATVLSIDQENEPSVLSIIAASLALHISDIPWNGPIAALRIGRIDNAFIINPTNEERKLSDIDLVLSGSGDTINMIEAGAKQVSEDDIVKSFEYGTSYLKKISDFIRSIREDVGKEKSKPALLTWSDEFELGVRNILQENSYEDILFEKDSKVAKYDSLNEVSEKIFSYTQEWVASIEPKGQASKEAASLIVDIVADELVHKNVLLQGKRPDGRALSEVRKITCRTGVLPRTHGTGLFTRGETQALTVATLGAPGAEQILDSMEENDTKKRYMHHYNFPPYSVGEVRPMRGPGRREIGHGALAERALEPLLPTKEDFPYTIRLVSEVLESNGSSSMASVCGSTLALMDAGVPIQAPASGIAMGIIIGEKDFKVLSDIQGLEDHFGDMDFKVAGTQKGITALQMDVKVEGVTVEMLKEVLRQSHGNRMDILNSIVSEIASPREKLSPYAPRIIILQINPDKIRDVIGPGGKIINEIISETGVEIDIEDDGSIFITAVDELGAEKAKQWIENLTREVKSGELFNAKITRIMNFGAFAEVLPGQEGLIHISQLSKERVEKVETIVKIGDIVKVKVIEIDNLGRINLSMKEASE